MEGRSRPSQCANGSVQVLITFQNVCLPVYCGNYWNCGFLREFVRSASCDCLCVRPNFIDIGSTLTTSRCIYIFFFASSWGPVAWVVTGELFPLKVRAKCLSMTTASNWLLNWAIAYSTPYMVDADHANLQSKVFFVWGSFCFVCIAFVYFMIYETKGECYNESTVL